MKEFSNLAAVVYKRTYARKDNQLLENFEDTVERMIRGNTMNHNVSKEEKDKLRYYLLNRKAGPAGRGWWFSGSPSHYRLGGVALNNCWYLSSEDWQNFVIAQDLLMLGGGVGLSIEKMFVSKLPKVKKDVKIYHTNSADADFIVPDSREGWCELTRRTLESFFVTGKGFSYSTIVVRGAGEKIAGFGGVSSGPLPLISCIEKIFDILKSREGKYIHPIDAMDIICSIGEMVVSGNVRRSAIIILGDPNDKEYLTSKRWDLGVVPNQRSAANLSVVADDFDDLHPLFWKTYEVGEPFGIVNRKAIRKFGRIGELKSDSATGVNPCGEACLENAEPCNLQEIALPNLASEQEFVEAAKLMHRWGKRVTDEKYHHPESDEVVKRNRRVGTGITGCLISPLFTPSVLDRVYEEIQKENQKYSKELEIPESIRTTVVKPSGTMSKMFDMCGYEGIHAAYSRYYIQRVRFAASDPLVKMLAAAGHHVEPVVRFDGTFDPDTVVVDFFEAAPANGPVADEDWGLTKQLDTLRLAQTHWADQSVSVTIYYKKDEIPQIKKWVADNLKNIKSVSFLAHSDHGFRQAPKEAISEQEYTQAVSKLKKLDINSIQDESNNIDGIECAGGVCPVK